jgi:cardiolipin synthase
VGVAADYIRAINQAEKFILIGNPYFIPQDDELKSALVKAADRGVRIKILWSSHSDAALLQEAAYPYVEEMLKNNIDIYAYSHGVFHGKLMIVDGRHLIIGTSNLDSRSLYINDEMNLFIEESPFLISVQQCLERDFSKSRQLSLAEIRNLTLREKVVMHLVKLISFSL